MHYTKKSYTYLLMKIYYLQLKSSLIYIKYFVYNKERQIHITNKTIYKQVYNLIESVLNTILYLKTKIIQIFYSFNIDGSYC